MKAEVCAFFSLFVFDISDCLGEVLAAQQVLARLF